MFVWLKRLNASARISTLVASENRKRRESRRSTFAILGKRKALRAMKGGRFACPEPTIPPETPPGASPEMVPANGLPETKDTMRETVSSLKRARARRWLFAFKKSGDQTALGTT